MNACIDIVSWYSSGSSRLQNIEMNNPIEMSSKSICVYAAPPAVVMDRRFANDLSGCHFSS
jgi:hypothetical protein